MDFGGGGEDRLIYLFLKEDDVHQEIFMRKAQKGFTNE